MNRTTARLAATAVGVGALTGLAVGAAHADEDSGASTDATREATAPDGLAPNYVLQGLPGLPIGDPVSPVFSVVAPAYGVVGALG
ncbi:hypothetical protein [Pseudonocardia endophytica]|uniref:Secreted protein n=1 Tax=Pseudonocardia endophytica TaxID=401976 RepID=A0A4R1HZI6_PSEEN|nr:hypothetical protein [Pseudonocardia endophytica]TCK25559.1 hypothetical protein EV378_1372 [Pseudonocardia endophytica]